MTDVRELKDEAARAMGRSQWLEAVRLYGELAAKEPKEGTWSLRAGDACRRLGQHREAIEWYELAATTYGECGFVVRAIAVGKMVQSLDPGNDRVLRALDESEKRPALKLPMRKNVEEKKPRGGPPPVPGDAKSPAPPPLRGRLTGPPLAARKPLDEPSMQSMEIVFDDVDDGIPIEEASILLLEETALAVVKRGENEQVLAELPSFPLFEILPRGAFLSFVGKLKHRSHDIGEVIVEEGDVGESMFAIIDGQATVYLNESPQTPLATLEAGQVFGEMALFLDQPRTATVEALTAVEVFEVTREMFRSLLDDYPQLGDVLSRLIKRRLVENVMATAALFDGLDTMARRELMLRFEVREVPSGTRIIEQGTAADGLYMVLTGQVRALHRDDDGQSREVGLLSTGQILGARALLDAAHQAAAAFEATRDTIALRLPRSAFNEVVCCYPPVLEHLSEIAENQRMWDESDLVPVV